MILLCGIVSEMPLALVRDALDNSGTAYRVCNQRQFANMEMRFELCGGNLSGWLEINGEGIALGDISGVYLRWMDMNHLPELRGHGPESSDYRRCAALQDALMRWTEITPARVVNRLSAMGSNASKPYQAQLIRQHGFDVPETLISTDPDTVRQFRALHNKLVYKSISGVRSIVQLLDEQALGRLGEIRWCPTQFQQFVEGTNVRVHVLGDQVFATEVHSAATDYRYAERQVGAAARLSACTLSDEVAQKCVALTRALGLDFSGVDLKFAPDGRVYCFEVNPSPGYSYFELHSGQAIAAALAQYLAQPDHCSPKRLSITSTGNPSTCDGSAGALFKEST